MSRIRIEIARKDSKRAISKALLRALGNELTDILFVKKSSNGEPRKRLTAEVDCEGIHCSEVKIAAETALCKVSRGRLVQVRLAH